ncbi:ATP-dependent RNA helicase, partial [Streptococcus dysgalactiae]
GGYRGDRNRDERDGDRRRQKRDKRDGHDGSGNRDFKRKPKRNAKDFFNKEKKSSPKNTGFVIRHKGE